MRVMDGYRTLGRIALVVTLVGVELWLAGDLTSHAAMQGYTATRSYSIAPPRRAKINTLLVELGASVRRGDVIAQLDTTEVDNELDAATAERSYAAAAVLAETARLQTLSRRVEGKFASSIEHASASLATSQATAHTAAAELAAIDAELIEQTDLVNKHLANAAVLNTLRLRRAALAKQVDAADQVLGVLRGNVAAATRRTEGLPPTDDDQLAPSQARLHVADLKIAQLTRERAGLSLCAPADGVIDQLPLHAGDLAAPELPVATLVAPDAARVVVCIPEARASAVQTGFQIDVTSTFDHARGTGEIESVTGTIGPLPSRCQVPGSKAVMMGRVAIAALDAPSGGLPGQTQLVKIHARRRARDGAPAAAPAPPPTERPAAAKPVSPPIGQVSAMQVPAALLARSRFEPSGLVWVPALDRYVIVSDDTGTKVRDDHAPWLFTMSATGVVDPEPIVIGGISEVDDLESIAADPDGSLWLLASQSVSLKGKRRAARQQLAHVVIAANHGMKVDRTIELAAVLDAAPAATRAALGLEDTRLLDIEAMAVHDGALYVGLKAPVDGDGRAVIWRIGAPSKLLAGDLPGARIELWTKLKLTVEADGRTVPAGIADMLFWDADTLLVSVTASGINPTTQAGALYVARFAGGELAPHHVRTFAGLKPEGLARAPVGDQLTIVFDRGNDPAQWLQLTADQIAAALLPVERKAEHVAR